MISTSIENPSKLKNSHNLSPISSKGILSTYNNMKNPITSITKIAQKAINII